MFIESNPQPFPFSSYNTFYKLKHDWLVIVTLSQSARSIIIKIDFDNLENSSFFFWGGRFVSGFIVVGFFWMGYNGSSNIINDVLTTVHWKWKLILFVKIYIYKKCSKIYLGKKNKRCWHFLFMTLLLIENLQVRNMFLWYGKSIRYDMYKLNNKNLVTKN